MQLKDAMNLIWSNRKYDTDSASEVIAHLNEEVTECLNALVKKDEKTAQQELEDAFSCIFIALKVMKIDPEDVIRRQVVRMKKTPAKTMHIFKDHVEIRINNEIKGGWNIWGPEDLQEAQKTAEEFKCKIVWEEAKQLNIVDIPLSQNND